MNRIKRIHLLIITVILFIGLAVAFVMVLVKPRQKNIAALDKRIAEEQQVANQLPQTQAALAAAQAQRATAEAKWNLIMRTKMSAISLADPYRAIFSIYKEIPTYAPQMKAAFNKDKRVRLNSNLAFAPYGFTPPPQSLPGRAYPQSLNFTARSFPDLLSWLRDTESLPRVLELGGNITITKTGAGLNFTIPGTVHIYFAEPSSATQANTPVTGTARTDSSAPMRRQPGTDERTRPTGLPRR